MNRPQLSLLAALSCLALLPVNSSLASSSAQSTANQERAAADSFNFAYRMEGERAIQPLQVFDDGARTYFQFRNGNRAVPAIVVDTGDSRYVATPTMHGPYVVVPGVAKSFQLQFQSLRAQVTSASVPPSAEGRPAAAAALSAVVNTVAAGTLSNEPSYPRRMTAFLSAPTYGTTVPVIGDPEPESASEMQRPYSVRIPFTVNSAKLSNEAAGLIRRALAKGTVVRAVIVGRDDAQFREGVATQRGKAIKAVLERYGIDAASISVREGFPLENDESRAPKSDLALIYAPKPNVVAGPGSPTSVRDSIALIESGLAGLVRLGALDTERAQAWLGWIKRSVTALPSSAPAPAAAPVERDQWVMAPSDQTVSAAVRSWGRQSGYEVEWRADYDLPVVNQIAFNGSFLNAFAAAMDAVKRRVPSISWRVEGKRIVVGQG